MHDLGLWPLTADEKEALMPPPLGLDPLPFQPIRFSDLTEQDFAEES